MCTLATGEFEHFKVQGRALFPQRARSRQPLIVEVVDFCLQKAAGIVQVFNFEPLRTLAKNIQAPVRIVLQDTHHFGNAADDRKSFTLSTNHAKADFLGQAKVHQFLVPVLENVER